MVYKGASIRHEDPLFRYSLLCIRHYISRNRHHLFGQETTILIFYFLNLGYGKGKQGRRLHWGIKRSSTMLMFTNRATKIPQQTIYT